MADEGSRTYTWKDILALLGIIVTTFLGGFWVGNSFRGERIQALRDENENLRKAHVEDTSKMSSLERKVDIFDSIFTSKVVLPDTALRRGDAISILFGEVTIICDSIESPRARIRIRSNNSAFEGIKNTSVYTGDNLSFSLRGKKYVLTVHGISNYPFKYFPNTEFSLFVAVQIAVYRVEE